MSTENVMMIIIIVLIVIIVVYYLYNSMKIESFGPMDNLSTTPRATTPRATTPSPRLECYNKLLTCFENKGLVEDCLGNNLTICRPIR